MVRSQGRKVFGLILLACMMYMPKSDAQILRGRVMDADTSAPLPAATVQIAGTYRGTITNNEGMYEIAVDDLPVDIVVRYIGFRTDTLTAHTLTPLEFRLEPVILEMEQLVVTEDDPAVWIMRQVIERKQIWREQLHTFEARAYARYTFSNDSGIVAIVESAATAWWDRDHGLREEVTGSRSTGNVPLGDVEALPAARTMVNLYDDDIEISGHTLMGVTHPDALERYIFTLEGTRKVDDVLVYDIAVAPKNNLSSTFLGSVSVLDGEFALIEARLRPGPAFLFPIPIQRYETTYLQQFSNYGGQIWLPIDLRSSTIVEIALGALLNFPTVGIDMVSRFTDYQLNVELADSLFEEGTWLQVDSSAVSSGESFQRDGAIVPLTPKETIAYASIDSTHSLREAFRPGGVLGRTMNRLEEAEERRASVERSVSVFRGSNSFISRLGLQPDLWYNRVDALHAGLGTKQDFGDIFEVQAKAGINTGQDGRGKYSYKGTFRIDKGWFMEAAYRAENASTYSSNIYRRLPNSILMLFGREDYFDYYRREGISLTGGYRIRRWGSATLTGTYLHEKHSGLVGNVSYDFMGKSTLQRPNGAIMEGDFRTFTATFRAGHDELVIIGIGPSRYFESSIELSMPWSDITFRRYYVRAGGRITTFLQRRFLPATLDFGITAGLASDGGRTLPRQRSFIVEGGTRIFHWGGSLYALQGLPYQGNAVVFGHWEHNFRTLLFEILGLRGMANKGYNVLIFGGHAFVRGTGSRHGEWIDHNELGVSLSGLFGFMRFDLAYRIGQNQFYPAIGVARIF